MRTHLLTVLGLALLVGAGATVAGDKAKVDLGWLAGRWCSADGGGYEEQWMSPKGGALIGMSREVRDGRMASFEFVRIADVDGVPTYHAQPGGRSPPTAFARIDGGATWVRFENKAHDFPQRIEYRRDGDRLDAEISGPGEGGKTMAIPFALKRCD